MAADNSSSSVAGLQGEEERTDASTDLHDNKEFGRGSTPTDLNSSIEGRRGRGESSSGEIFSDDEEAAYFPKRVKSRRRSHDHSPSYSSSGDVSRKRSDRSRSPVSKRSRRRSISSDRGDVRSGRGSRRRSRSPRWSTRYRSSDEDERDSKTGEDYSHGRSQHRLSSRDGFGSPKSRYGSPGGRYGMDSRKDAGRGGHDSDSDSYHYSSKSGGRGRKFGGYGQTKNYQQHGMGKRSYGRGAGVKPSGNYGGYSGRMYHGMGGNSDMRGIVLTQEEITSRRQSGKGLLIAPKDQKKCSDLDQFNYPAEPTWYLEEVSKWEKREEEKKAVEEKSLENIEDVAKKEEEGSENKLKGEREVNGRSAEKNQEPEQQQKLWYIDKGSNLEVRECSSNDSVGEKTTEPSTQVAFNAAGVNEVGVVRNVLEAVPSQTSPLVSASEAVAGTISKECSASGVVSAIGTQMSAMLNATNDSNISTAITKTTASVSSSPLVSPTFEGEGALKMATSPVLPSSVSNVEGLEKDGVTASTSSKVSISQVEVPNAVANSDHFPPGVLPQVSSTPSPNTATESTSTAVDASPAAAADISSAAAEPCHHTTEQDVPMETTTSSPLGANASGSVGVTQEGDGVESVSSDNTQLGLPNQGAESVDQGMEKTSIPEQRGPFESTSTAQIDEAGKHSKMGMSGIVGKPTDDMGMPDEVNSASEMKTSTDIHASGDAESANEVGVTGNVESSEQAGGDDRLKVNPQERLILFSEISRIQVYVAPVNDSAAPPLSPSNNPSQGTGSTLQVALETTPISPATSDEEMSHSMEVSPTVQSLSQNNQIAKDSIEGNEDSVKNEERTAKETGTLQEFNEGDEDDVFNYSLRSRKRPREGAKNPPSFRPKLLSESDNDVSYDDYLDQLVDEEEDDEEPLGKELEDGPLKRGVSARFPPGSKNEPTKVASAKNGGTKDTDLIADAGVRLSASGAAITTGDVLKGKFCSSIMIRLTHLSSDGHHVIAFCTELLLNMVVVCVTCAVRSHVVKWFSTENKARNTHPPT